MLYGHTGEVPKLDDYVVPIARRESYGQAVT